MAQPRTKTASKATSTVTVGCKVANGIVMQVGDQAVDINGFNQQVVVGGHGITRDVPKDLWEAWLEENKNRKLCTGGFIFADESTKSVNSEAGEKVDNQSGTEPLVPPKEDTV